MVARAASGPPAFSPLDRPRVAIAGDGRWAAVADSTRIGLIELPGRATSAELALEAEARASEIAWVGAPPQLAVLTRHPAHTTVRLVDPHGARPLGELRLDAPMRLLSSVGPHVLAVGPPGVVVLTAADGQLTPHPLPVRSVPTTAGAAGGHFVIAAAGGIEEWDPHSRTPKRRLRLVRAGTITALGGSERVVWMTTQQQPSRIDVIPLVNRGQPRVHELPEPIAHVSGQPTSDLVVCVGAATGRLYVIDLDRHGPPRVVGAEDLDRVEAAALVDVAMSAVVAAQACRPLALVPLERDEAELGSEEAPLATLMPDAERAAAPPAARGEDAHPGPPPVPLELAPPRWSWRDDVVAWARAVMSGAAERGAPPAPPIDALAARFELPAHLVPALVLLYGAHLAGERGAAPVDVARVLGRRWDEALGRGQLVSRALASCAGSRLRLTRPIQRVLDELPATTGQLVGAPGAIALLGPCVVVAAGEPLAVVAERCCGRVGGAILAAHDGADRGALFVEARAWGAIPMLRVQADDPAARAAEPTILVVDDADLVTQLGIPQLA